MTKPRCIDCGKRHERGKCKKGVTRFKCVVCGLVTVGTLPRGPWGAEGDGSELWPTRHKVNGKPCPGNDRFAEWVTRPKTERPYGYGPKRHERYLRTGFA